MGTVKSAVTMALLNVAYCSLDIKVAASLGYRLVSSRQLEIICYHPQQGGGALGLTFTSCNTWNGQSDGIQQMRGAHGPSYPKREGVKRFEFGRDPEQIAGPRGMRPCDAARRELVRSS